MSDLIPQEQIEDKILVIRGIKVMIDRDLAELYGVETKNLNRQVKRNMERFPQEFMFQLTRTEKDELVTNWHRFMSLKHSTVRPYAFTEQGVAMLSSVLNSKRAIQVNIIIIKTFMKLREIISLHKGLAQKLSQLERKYERHDEQIHAIFGQIREFMTFKEKPKRQIGFK
jgi:hypothetical protein